MFRIPASRSRKYPQLFEPLSPLVRQHLVPKVALTDRLLQLPSLLQGARNGTAQNGYLAKVSHHISEARPVLVDLHLRVSSRMAARNLAE